MRVLVADKFEQSGLDGLAAAGCSVVYEPDLEGDRLRAALQATGAAVLIVRGTTVPATVLDSRFPLSLIVRAGAGYNTIDVAAASRKGIYVSNCPGKNAIAVAELTFALILALDRRVFDNVAELRAGRWNKKEFTKASGLFGRTIGLLGFGNIGHEVGSRAHAFGMKVLVWSRRFADGRDKGDEQMPIEIVRSPEELAGRCDVLSLHLALTPETRGIVNASLLSRLKPGAIFINTARGELVDEVALEQAVRDRGLRAGLDVFAGEPQSGTGSFQHRLAQLPGVYGTHHIGASTDQAQEAIATEAVRVVTEYKNTGRVPNVVNLAARTPATHMLVVRHLDRPGVLAHVFDCLRSAQINVQETANVVFEGAQAAVARINLNQEPSRELLDCIKSGNADIMDAEIIKI